LFSKAKNKTFKYQPRFSIKAKTDVSATDGDFIYSWTKKQRKNRKSRATTSIKVLLLLLVLLLIGIYYLEMFIIE